MIPSFELTLSSMKLTCFALLSLVALISHINYESLDKEEDFDMSKIDPNDIEEVQ